LLYDSQSYIGPLGIGWSLAGLSAITRCNKTVAQDTTAAPVALVTSDGYCLDGKRLRLTSGTYGTAGSTYQTEVADFSNVTANGTAGNGPAYFTVQGRDGLTYEYGYTDSNGNGANSEVLATGTTTALTWLLSKVVDRAGNNYVINYTKLSGTAVPATILWTPTSAGASTYTYTMTFNYTANVPQSSINGYVAGTLVSNADLLSSIAISSSGTIIRDYFLGYQASPTTGRDELTSVKECTDSTQSSCLLPTAVSYQGGAPGVSTTALTALSSSGADLTARYDFNGDGYPDIAYQNPNGSNMLVSFGSSSGYGAPVNAGNVGTLIGRIDGGNQDEFLGVSGGTWWCYKWNGSSFVGTNTGLTYDSTATQYQLADVNGDGLPDLVALYVVYNKNLGYSNITIKTWINTTSGGTVSFNSTPNTAYTAIALQAQLETPDMQYGKLRRYDFNGDGRDDLVLLTITGFNGKYSEHEYELLSTGTAFTATEIESQSSSTFTPVFFTDWNDDKCTDYVASPTLYISGCNGSVPQSYTVGAVIGAMDWSGDGRTDLIVDNGSTLGIVPSTGSGVGALVATSIPYSSTCTYVTMDADGDGLDDLGCLSSGPLTYYPHNGLADVANSFTDGYGVRYAPSYVSIADSGGIYTKGTSAVFPEQDYAGLLDVVSSYQASDGIGGNYTESFGYTGAIVNVQGRGFEGFTEIQSKDSRTGNNTFTSYSTTFPETGMLSSYKVTQSNTADVIRQVTPHVTVVTLDSSANNERYYPYDDTVAVNDYEVGGAENAQLITTTATAYTAADNYGNFGSVAKTVTDEDPNSPYHSDTYTSTTTNTITANTSTWCLALPTETQVTNSSTAPGGAAITRTVSDTPDYTHCRETEQIAEPSSSLYKVTTGYGYDGFGNVNSETVTGINMTARTTTLTWGTTGQSVHTVTNPLSQTTTLGYDPGTDLLTSVQDPNGILTSWQYDGFGRKSKETRPDGTSTTWSYNDCTSTGCVNGNNQMTVTQTALNVGGTMQSVQNTYLDAFDRPLVVSRTMLNGAYDRREIQYDKLGNVHLQGAPCTFISCANYWTTNTYDVVNRLIESQRPISATDPSLQTTSYTYQGRTSTVTDPLGNTTTRITMVTGNIGRVQGPNGYDENFTYDAFGSLLSVTDSASPANTLFSAQYAYGIGAFKTSSTDMDLGARTYTVDALGEVTAYSDAKNQNFSMSYDALSRPYIRTEPDLTTTWTWGTSAASDNIGKLQSIAAAGSAGTYTAAYTYDGAGRPSTETLTLPGDATYTYTKTYNATTGFLDTLQYPVSTSSYQLKLQYAYANGLLQSISDYNAPSTVFWTANAQDPRGQVTQETMGNGVVANHTYDAVTGWIDSIQAGVGGGAALQNNAYLFDEDGNVTQRQDNNLGLTENFYYDDMNRLSHSTLNGTTNLSLTYDTTGMGNIASRSDVAGGAAWTYDPVHKHQVTQAGSSAYTYAYDANGNVTSRNGYLITWTSYNYPDGINSSGESALFWYGPFRQRWRTEYTGPNGTENTYHVDKLLEKVAGGGTTDYRHYIFAGNELVAVYNRSSTGTNTLTYVLSDHQGSFAHLVTSAGTNDVTESFTAYGNRRSGTTWSGSPSSGDETAINAVSRWGYTGETVLGVSMGLNDLNGRVEDAITGRFLSADPYVPDPENTQSFNRYSYVNNDPLTFVDPTGFDTTYQVNCIGAGLCPSSDAPAGADSNQLATIVVTGSKDPNNGADIGTNSTSGGAAAGSSDGGGGGGGGSRPKPPAQSKGGLCSNASINAISGAAGGAVAGGAALSELGVGGVAVGVFFGGLVGGIVGYVSSPTLVNQVVGGAVDGAATGGVGGGVVGGAVTYAAQQTGLLPDVVSVPAGSAVGGFFSGAAATGAANSDLSAAEGGATGGAVGLAAGATQVAVAAALNALCGN